MRRIERTTAFKRDFKREKKGRHRDHVLSGNWAAVRECHIKPDLLLIYEKPEGLLRLIRLGSHSELFG